MKKLIFLLLLLPFFLFAEDNSDIEVKTVQDIIEKTAVDHQEVEKKTDEEVKKEETKQDEPFQQEELVDEKQEEEVKTLFLTSYDTLIEYDGSHSIMWIRKKENIRSVAFVTDTSKSPSYYLRSEGLLNENNELTYQGNKIGNLQNLFFLSSSKVEKHPLFGEAFKIMVPQKMIYGYSHSFYGELERIDGQTGFTIRCFTKKYGNGKFIDTPYLLPEKQWKAMLPKKLFLAGQEEKGDSVILYYSYQSPKISAEKILMQKNLEKEILFDFNYPMLYLSDENNFYFKMINWFYDKKEKLFKITFSLKVKKEIFQEKFNVLVTDADTETVFSFTPSHSQKEAKEEAEEKETTEKENLNDTAQ
ncbi:MAG TPA: hypothetical protein DHW82_07585 [Spirochaetia bacterium]|nr:MAG: hypothetical protein A2Y41_13035 [Spirochaetes bacterium GWB1_36_13]HCL56855.1 hypothetical protein [Spirochaetia bacterium]